MKRLSMFIMLMLLGLVACRDGTRLTAGIVVDRASCPAKTWVQLAEVPKPSLLGLRAGGMTFYLPVLICCREQYRIVIEGTPRDERVLIRRVLYISRENFERALGGSFYVVQPTDRDEISIEKREATAAEQAQYGVLGRSPEK